eukprot:1143517-Pelagomonas_calceolata.AAC.17
MPGIDNTKTTQVSAKTTHVPEIDNTKTTRVSAKDNTCVRDRQHKDNTSISKRQHMRQEMTTRVSENGSTCV